MHLGPKAGAMIEFKRFYGMFRSKSLEVVSGLFTSATFVSHASKPDRKSVCETA